MDNAVNRKLGRVGKPLGQHVVHKDGSMTKEGITYTQSGDRCYKDNARNKHLGRVRLLIPTRRNRIEEIAENYTLEEAIALLQRMGFEEDTHLEHQYAVDRLNREDVEEGSVYFSAIRFFRYREKTNKREKGVIRISH